MAASELDQVLDVIYRAILRETSSFNYYYGSSNDPSLPDGVRGLLAKLAEEERGHRKMLLQEYRAIQKGWGDSDPASGERSGLSYQLPEEPEPVKLPTASSLDVMAVSLPAMLLGGDNILTRVITSPDGRDIGMFLVLYDAMGHGIETTRINSSAASILGEYMDSSVSAAAQSEMLSPARVVSHLNARFSQEYSDSGVFLTMFAGYFDLVAKTLRYTIAGHEPPMIMRSTRSLEPLFDTQLIVGIDQGRKYQEHTVDFGHSDSLCLFSDGILEARDPDGEVYGRQRLNDALAELAGGSSQDILRGVLRKLRNFCHGRPMEDELTMIIVNCCG